MQVEDHILDTSLKDSYSVAPDEWEWSKLPGRCCYDVTRPSCNVCKYWGNPDDFCHRSRGHCAENCSPRNEPGAVDANGDPLPELAPLTYCEGAPPPLIDGGKVCVGNSRLSEPCYDELNTGKCVAFGMLTCQNYCWWTPGCAIFVVYAVLDSGDNLDGSCVLCYDLHSHESTPKYHTRAYRYTQPNTVLPPAPPSQPSPSPPPKPPPPPPPPLDDSVVRTGLDDQDSASCTYHAPYELVYEDNAHPRHQPVEGENIFVPPPPPPENAMAEARVEKTADPVACCTACAGDVKCEGFVYEQASSVCVLLPGARDARLVPRYNAGMTSGFVRRFQSSNVSPSPAPPPAQCSYATDQGFAGPNEVTIGSGQPPRGVLMTSREICCGSCAFHPDCAKFTYVPNTWSPGRVGVCTMFTGLAEAFIKKGSNLEGGVVLSKDVAQHFLHSPTPPQALDKPRPSPPPLPPEFPFMAILKLEDILGGKQQAENKKHSSVGDETPPLATVLSSLASFAGASLMIACVARRVFFVAKPKPRVRPRDLDVSGIRPRRAITQEMPLKPASSEEEENHSSEDEGEDDQDSEADARANPFLDRVGRACLTDAGGRTAASRGQYDQEDDGMPPVGCVPNRMRGQRRLTDTAHPAVQVQTGRRGRNAAMESGRPQI